VLLTILTRYFIVLVSLLALPTTVAIWLVFTHGAKSIYAPDFVGPVETYLVFLPFVTAALVVPNTIREFRSKKKEGDGER
jgi:hypothetical protein